MNNDELKNVWLDFTRNNDFKLNPDENHVNMIIEGIISNERKSGLKLCPCRLRDDTRDRDLELLCPCNFKSHETWVTRGECWCGLFVKK
ncbi:MAG: ferredoxin-thioredoxin reductase catalytic domain-containing protein [Candidatus Altiarchaeota archaeon]